MGQSAFGTLLKRGDGALRTLTFATCLQGTTIIIDGVTFTAHTDTTTLADREFDISGDDSADALEFLTIVNDSTYGITGLTASQVAGVVTLTNDGVLSDENDSLTIAGTAVGVTVTDAAATEAFTTVPGMTNVDGPALGMETIDVTSHDSPGATRQTVASFKDPGTVSGDMNWDPTSASVDINTGIGFDWNNRTIRNWQNVYPTSPVETFSYAGRVTGYNPTAPADGKLGAAIEITLSGTVTQA